MTKETDARFISGANLSKKNIMLGNFLGGLAWGLGSVIGATIVVAVLIGVLRSFNFLPFVNDFADTVEQKTRPVERQIQQNR